MIGIAFVSGVLYGVEAEDSNLYTIDPVDGTLLDSITITLHGAASVGVTGLASFDDILYGLVKPGRVLATIDPTTGVATTIGQVGKGFAGLAFTPNVTLIGVTGDGGGGTVTPETLYTISTDDASQTLICELGAGDDGETIAFDPVSCLLYHASGNAEHIFESVDLGDVCSTSGGGSGGDSKQDQKLTVIEDLIVLKGSDKKIDKKIDKAIKKFKKAWEHAQHALKKL